MSDRYIGVYPTTTRWYARCRHNGQQIYIGTFDTPEEAAKAYDDKVYELKGDNAKFNFRNNIHKCEAPNCECNSTTKFQNYWVCQKHKSQLKQRGCFLQRTIYDVNEIIKDGRYSFIILYNKKCEEIARTKIDTKNIDMIKDYKWYLRPDGYVATNNYNGKYEYLHNVICKKKDKKYIDHIDRDKLNNTEDNLREATGSENQMNKGIHGKNTSGKTGVYWSKSQNAWCVMIGFQYKRKNLGYFKSYDDAVACRMQAEKDYFKEYRVQNEKS